MQSSGTGCPGTPGSRRSAPATRRRRAPGASSRPARRSPSRADRAAGRRPAARRPASVRAGKVSDISRAPVPAATRAAASWPSSRHRRPRRGTAPSARRAPAPRRRPRSRTAPPAAPAGPAAGRRPRRRPPRTRPPAGPAWRSAAPPTRPRPRRRRRAATSAGDSDRRTQPETVPATRVDVGLQRRVEPLVRPRVVADDVDHRGPAAAGVVQVGQAVGHARPEVQQRGRGAAGHPRVAVGRAGGDALEQGEHRRACRGRRPARRRSASPTCRGWRSRRRRRRPPACGSGPGRRSPRRRSPSGPRSATERDAAGREVGEVLAAPPGPPATTATPAHRLLRVEARVPRPGTGPGCDGVRADAACPRSAAPARAACRAERRCGCSR